jgi:hypothetical protein
LEAKKKFTIPNEKKRHAHVISIVKYTNNQAF